MSDRPMTLEAIRVATEHLLKISGDDEAAHSWEDAMREEVLAAIAKGAPNAAELAAEVLKTNEIRFSRWCA